MLVGMLWFKIIVGSLFLVMIASLASALVSLLRDRGRTGRTLKALKLRIAASIAAFALLIAGYLAGWIQPHGIVPPPATPQQQAPPATHQ